MNGKSWRKQIVAVTQGPASIDKYRQRAAHGVWLVGMIVVIATISTACASPEQPTAAPATAVPATAVPATAAPAKVALRGGTQLTPTSVSWAPYYSIGEYLGWFKDENLDVTMDNLQTAVLLTLLTKGDIQFFIGAPEALFGVEGQGTKTGVKMAYDYYTHPWYLLATTPESPIKTIADLKGKTIGLSTLGAPQVPALAEYLREGGLTTDDVKMVAVGNKVSAAQNLKDGQVDALQEIANNFTIFENAGFKYRYFPVPQELDNLFGAGYYVNNSALSDPTLKDALGRYFRVVAKSVVFAKTNPEAAVCIHWKVKPESKPTGQSEAEAMQLAKNELATAMKYAGTKPKAGQWGEYTEEQVRQYIAFSGLSDKLTNPQDYYTNAFIAAANNFNEDEVVNFAKNYKCQ